jgi:hypothetical protein
MLRVYKMLTACTLYCSKTKEIELHNRMNSDESGGEELDIALFTGHTLPACPLEHVSCAKPGLWSWVAR